MRNYFAYHFVDVEYGTDEESLSEAQFLGRDRDEAMELADKFVQEALTVIKRKTNDGKVWFKLNDDNFYMMLYFINAGFFNVVRDESQLEVPNWWGFITREEFLSAVEYDESPRKTWSHGH